MRRYEDMQVVALNAEQHAQTCNYWYLVREAFYAHTAFTTRKGLERWLEERGLTCEIPTAVEVEDYGKGFSNTSPVIGKYGTKMLWNMGEFYALPNVVVRSKTLSNGDWVEAMITQEDGLRVEYTLNPNVKDRKVFDWREVIKEMN